MNRSAARKRIARDNRSWYVQVNFGGNEWYTHAGPLTSSDYAYQEKARLEKRQPYGVVGIRVIGR